MNQPTLAVGAFCVCLDDPWDGMRSLVIETIARSHADLREDHDFTSAGTVSLPLNRLFYNPYRNAVARLSSGRDATPDEDRQLDRAALVRVVTGHLAADGRPKALADLKSELAAFLPALPHDFIDNCLRAMTSSGALSVEQPKPGKKPPKEVKLRASRSVRESEQVSGYAFSFANELQSQSRRFGQLVKHRGTAGSYREELLRVLLRKTLAERYHVATGFIEGCDLQLDVIIYDRIDYAPVFREGDLVVVSMDSVRAVIEVKTRLTTQSLKEALEHLNALPFELEAPIFKGVFAFETDIPDNRLLGHVAAYYDDPMSIWAQPYDEISAICVLERQLVLTGYGGDPVRPVLSLVRSLIGRDFQAAGFLDTMQNYLRTPAPRVLRDGLSSRQLLELSASYRSYLEGMWQVIMAADEDLTGGEGGRQRALYRILRVSRWLSDEAPW